MPHPGYMMTKGYKNQQITSDTSALLPSLFPSHSTESQRNSSPPFIEIDPKELQSGHTRHRHQQQPRSKSLIDDHPFCRAYGVIMGQVHPRGSVELEVSHSTGPDPTVFKQHPRFPNVQIVSNSPSPHHRQQPQHQSQAMQSTRTDESIYTPRSTPVIPTPKSNANQGGPRPPMPQNLSSSQSIGLGRSLGGIGLPMTKPNGFASKPKSLVRKLSKKSPPPPPVQVPNQNQNQNQNQSKKSMGPDPFEARPFSPLQSAFDPVEMLGSGDGPGTLQFQQQQQGLGLGAGSDEIGAKKVKAGTFPRGLGGGIGNRRISGIPDLTIFSSSQTSTAFPITTRASPAIINSVPESSGNQIRSASGSIHSHHKTSIKSSPSKRAEREWRAKVAGLAINNRSPKAGGRGPVPPRRNPLAVTVPCPPGPTSTELLGLVSRVKTPITPLPLRSPVAASGPMEDDKGTPAKSFVSNRSFETLGHHPAPSPTRAVPQVRQLSSTASPGSRQCDVPQSVVSSFYFDNRASRVSTHLSPVVQSQTRLPTLTLMSETVSAHVPAVESGLGSESSAPKYKTTLPPFSSFQLSPASVGPPLSPVPVTNPRDAQARVTSSAALLPSVPGARRSSSGLVQSETQRTSFAHHGADFTLATSQSSSSSGPKTPLRSEAGLERETDEDHVVSVVPPKTPISNKHHIQSDVHSPYSPTTAYIIQSEDIDHSHLHLFAGFHDRDHAGFDRSSRCRLDVDEGSRSRERHPYARTPSMLIDSPPQPARCETYTHAPLHIQKQIQAKVETARRTQPLCPRHEVVSPPCRHTPHLSSPQHHHPHHPPPHHPHHHPQPHAHGPSRRHQHAHHYRQESQGIKADIIGADSRSRSYGASGSSVLSTRKVDLTPGMDSGYRPPKSGLPVADLERWLASTSISS